jgi:hypothetical protein
MNHPVVIWARSSIAHVAWLATHLDGLLGFALKHYYANNRKGSDYQWACQSLRNIVNHPSVDEVKILNNPIPSGSFLNFAKNNAKGLDFTGVRDVHLAYRLFLNAQRNESSS